MTAPSPVETDSPGLHVTALLLAARIDDALVDTLLGLADQVRPADALIVLDATATGEIADRLTRSGGLADQLPPTTVHRVDPGTSLRGALRMVLDLFEPAPADAPPDAFWLLSGDTSPEVGALDQLAGTLEGSPAVGLAAPKLTSADRPNRLQRFGIQVTRSGRLQFAPRPGEPDQQQYDDRVDALAAPAEGLLVRRTTLEDLGGHSTAFGALGADLDFGWRAQLAGHRLELNPRARVRLATSYPPAPSAVDRRDARRVALARGPIALWPVRAVWIAVSTAVIALGLAVLKRPTLARRQAADLIALADPWRPIAARWRTRGRRRVRHRDLRGLFVNASQTRARMGDRLHDIVVPRSAAADTAPPPVTVSDPGPPLLSWPAVAVILLVALAAGAAARTLPGGFGTGFGSGFLGGELRPVSADAAALWHSWWDGWSGPGLGREAPGAPGLAVLGLLTWLYQLLPGDAGGNPAGRVVGLAMTLALPLAGIVAYLAGRVVTRRRWPRAAVALLWALSPVATIALAQGRLGALAALVLLPMVLAGFVAMSRPTVRPGSIALTALGTAALAAVLPGILVVAVLIGMAMLLVGGTVARVRALALLPLLALAAAPTLLRVREVPSSLLAGWGLLTTDSAPPPWQVALLHPGAAATDGTPLGAFGDYRLWLTLPILLLACLGLARPVRRGGLALAAAVLALTGLALALAAPHLELGRSTSGAVVHPWPGLGQLLLLAGLLGAGLLAFGGDGAEPDPAPERGAVAGSAVRHGSSIAAVAEGAVRPGRGRGWAVTGAVLAGAGALALGGQLAWGGLGVTLVPATDPRPAVAIDQADGPAATRTVVLRAVEESVEYDLIGREPGQPARDLDPAPANAGLTVAIAAVLDPVGGAAAGDPGDPGTAAEDAARDPAGALGRWAVGFVVAEPSIGDEVVRGLDATSGLTRIGDHEGRAVWRVEAVSGTDRLPPARVRQQPDAADQDGGAWGSTVPVTGSHAATRTALPGVGGTLIVAEPAGWGRVARVSADGTRLSPRTAPGGQLAYALPASADEVRIVIPPRHRLTQLAYLALLVLLVYLALPLGAPPRVSVAGDEPLDPAPASGPSPNPAGPGRSPAGVVPAEETGRTPVLPRSETQASGDPAPDQQVSGNPAADGPARDQRAPNHPAPGGPTADDR